MIYWRNRYGTFIILYIEDEVMKSFLRCFYNYGERAYCLIENWQIISEKIKQNRGNWMDESFHRVDGGDLYHRYIDLFNDYKKLIY